MPGGCYVRFSIHLQTNNCFVCSMSKTRWIIEKFLSFVNKLDLSTLLAGHDQILFSAPEEQRNHSKPNPVVLTLPALNVY